MTRSAILFVNAMGAAEKRQTSIMNSRRTSKAHHPLGNPRKSGAQHPYVSQAETLSSSSPGGRMRDPKDRDRGPLRPAIIYCWVT